MLSILKGAFTGAFGFKGFAIILAMAMSFSAASALYVDHQLDKAKEVDRLRAQVTAINEARAERDEWWAAYVDEVRAEQGRVRALDQQAIQTLETTARRLEMRRAELWKEREQYVQDLHECRLSFDAVGVLNRARIESFPANERGPMRDATRPLAGEGATTSTIGLPEVVDAHNECALAYSELSGQHNALIDWLLGYHEELK